MTQRTVREIRAAHASRDGDGVAIQRIAGMQHAAMDPILMIDELRSEHRADFAGGFPPHPHRGMQTLTYMKRGGIIHEDNQGNRGEIRGGGAQWMSAGRGIVHSEMPTQDTTGLHGFQLWVNLPRAQKMSAPRYRDVPWQALAHIDGTGFRATAIAGEWQLQPAAGGANVLLLRGEPLGEPVAQYGPFVMNTPEEIEQAIADYQSGNFGAATI